MATAPSKSPSTQRVIGVNVELHKELQRIQRRMSVEQERSIPMHEVITIILAASKLK